MNHEISQLDIPDRQLLASNARPSVWTEIGEAQITHTIFGRAKVRIIRKNDNQHRVLWLTGIAAIAIAAAAWQGLFTSQQPEQSQSTDQPSAGIKEPVNAPAIQSENIATPVTPREAMKKPDVPTQAKIDKAAIIPKNAPHQAPVPIIPEPKLANPEMSRPKPNVVQQKPIFVQPRSITTEPQVVSPQVAPNSASGAVKSPTNTQPQINLLAPKPTGAAVPALSATKPAVQPAASSPAAVFQLSDPVMKPTDVPATDNQPLAPDNAQSK